MTIPGHITKLAAAGIAMFCVAASSAPVAAQVTLTAPANVSTTHDLTSGDQVFESVIWHAENSSLLSGATVVLSCGPFVHESLPANRADARLTILIQSQDLGAVWLPLIHTSHTHIDMGDDDAVVVAGSALTGDAQISLKTRFLGVPPGTLAAGVYKTTVTGTITAN